MSVENNFSNESRGYKTKGRSYKDRYVNDKICLECGGNSVYKDVWATTISYKCMKRSCRHHWYEQISLQQKADEIAEVEENTTQ